MWIWLKLLMPSWRFFDSVDRGLFLEIQTDEQWKRWKPRALPPFLLCLFHNPKGNEALVLFTLIERSVDGFEVQQARNQIHQILRKYYSTPFRYRILGIEFGKLDGEEVLFESEILS